MNAAKRNKLYNALVEISENVWEEVNIESGSELYEDLEKQERYFAAMAMGINETIPEIQGQTLDQYFYDKLEDENYASLNNYLSLMGYFGEQKKSILH